MDECSCPRADVPIRQGDIFRWQQRDVSESEYRLGVILTADCDIAQNKFGSHLSYVPIVSLQDYISSVLVPSKLQKLYDHHVYELVGTIHKQHKNINPEAEKLSLSAAEHWIQTNSSAEISNILGFPESKQRSSFEKRCDLARQAKIALSSYCNDSKMQALISLVQDKTNGSPSSAISKIAEQLKSAMFNGGSDIFFISSISGASDVGFITMLRQIQAARFDDLTTSSESCREDPSKAIRIARLNDVYKYALTQQFANLFSRIGMPPSYEDSQEMVISDACQTLTRSLEEKYNNA